MPRLANKSRFTGRSRIRWASREITADDVKLGVDKWGRDRGFFTLNEVEGLVNGRLDVVLVPVAIDCPLWLSLKGRGKFWTERCGIAGVEVKVDKQDFKHGLESRQFERYSQDLSGLYIAGPASVVDHKLVPVEFGVLHVAKDVLTREITVVCRRHPKWIDRGEMSADKAWKLVWCMAKSARRKFRAMEEKQTLALQKVRDAAGIAIGKAVRHLHSEADHA